jgi:hypothetical protein
MSDFGLQQKKRDETTKMFGRLFKTGSDMRSLRRANPVDVFDKKVEFYEYLVADVATGRKVEHDIDHDTGELGAPLLPGCVLAEHKYFIDGIPQKGSATSYVHSFFEHFDSKAQSRRIADGHRILTDPEYKYFMFGVEQFEHAFLKSFGGEKEPLSTFWNAFALLSQTNPTHPARGSLIDFEKSYREFARQAILDDWHANSVEALTLGRAMHRAVELCYNSAYDLSDPVFYTPEMHQFAQFHEFWVLPRKLKMFRTELSLAHAPDPTQPDVYLCGTIDAVFIGEDGSITLADWKRSKEIKKEAFNANDVGTGPCAGMPNCNLYHYYLQLNTYQYMLEQNSTYRVKNRHIVVFHPNQSAYAVYDVPLYQERIQAAMKLYCSRKETIDVHIHDD